MDISRHGESIVSIVSSMINNDKIASWIHGLSLLSFYFMRGDDMENQWFFMVTTWSLWDEAMDFDTRWLPKSFCGSPLVTMFFFPSSW